MSTHRIFQNFLNLLINANNADGFSDALAVTGRALELPCLAYLGWPKRRGENAFVISTYPANWVAHYVRNHYERLDPIIERALATTEPFSWDHKEPHKLRSPAQRSLLDEGAQCGIRLGFTVPIHNGASMAALTFATDQNDRAFQLGIERRSEVLQFMAISFDRRVRQKLSHELVIANVELSRREMECLDWVAKGKTTWEIGQILQISPNTVKSYLNNAKNKLGVRTLAEATSRLGAAKAVRQD
ncbi:LuxR family transcriptional regulator (plasmid) [Bradyrhizobium sp. 62B]|uniref:LuxR family transcriptional regulator n=1 Tax=Bradyrhizobium sp. 62B TaxID=2898442 RepID=UPI0025583954|nr:LuxR family transcriptional regulator [Bradyrhizobium sp. 62B]